jgi:hypothetical protein
MRSQLVSLSCLLQWEALADHALLAGGEEPIAAGLVEEEGGPRASTRARRVNTHAGDVLIKEAAHLVPRTSELRFIHGLSFGSDSRVIFIQKCSSLLFSNVFKNGDKVAEKGIGIWWGKESRWRRKESRSFSGS